MKKEGCENIRKRCLVEQFQHRRVDKSLELYSRELDNSSRFDRITVVLEHTVKGQVQREGTKWIALIKA